MHVKSILNDFNLKSTPCRSMVLTLLSKNERAMASAEIEQQIDQTIDRVTVYRTLRTFLDKGLIHKVLDDEGVAKYALCQECCSEGHNHEHVHFKCERCGQTQCLDDVEIPEIKLPKGFRSRQKNILIQGRCDRCK